MGRIKPETIGLINEMFDQFEGVLGKDALSKCSICRETLTHIVVKTEVETGAPRSTVTRELAGRINEGAAPLDRVNGNQLRQRVIGQTTDKNLSVRSEQIGNNPEDQLPLPFDPDDPEIRDQIQTDEKRTADVGANRMYSTHLLDPLGAILACPMGPQEVYELIPDFRLYHLENLSQAIEFLSEIKTIHEVNHERVEQNH